MRVTYRSWKHGTRVSGRVLSSDDGVVALVSECDVARGEGFVLVTSEGAAKAGDTITIEFDDRGVMGRWRILPA